MKFFCIFSIDHNMYVSNVLDGDKTMFMYNDRQRMEFSRYEDAANTIERYKSSYKRAIKFQIHKFEIVQKIDYYGRVAQRYGRVAQR